jgi:hypothetical protein
MNLHEYENIDAGIIWLSDPFDLEAILTRPEHAHAEAGSYVAGHTNVVFFLRLEWTEYFSREMAAEGKKVLFSVGCVCEAVVLPDDLTSMLQSIGLSRAEWDRGSLQAKSAELVRSGYAAILWQQTGKRQSGGEREGRRRLDYYEREPTAWVHDMLEAQNQVGATGFDRMKSKRR